MSVFTEQQRREIEKIVNRNLPIKTSIFDDIDPKKLSNARASFGRGIKPDEEIFMQYDDTVFGSAREGILMTTVGMHTNGNMRGKRFIPYDDILSMGKSSLASFSINLKDSHQIRLDANHDTRKIFALVGDLVNYMQQNQNKISNHLLQPTHASPSAKIDYRCAGCGAPNHSGQSFCEYCGSPLIT